MAAALALTAAIGLGGLAQASMASADSIGRVDVGPLPLEDANDWQAGWGRAWDLCHYYYPGTRSVSLHDSFPQPDPTNNRTVAIQVWDCRNTA